MWSKLPVLRAFVQTASQVVVRAPGKRILGAPLPIGPYAKEHWEFAWLSVAAYQETHAGKLHAARMNAARTAVVGTSAVSTNIIGTNATPTPLAVTAAPDPQRSLAAVGWTQWIGFPDDALQGKIHDSHLRVEVWERQEPPAVAVTFGGTVFNNDADWLANLRWFIPWHRDEYTDVVQTFAPAFAKELVRRAQATPSERLSRMNLYSTGHSLGGGLAQQFAYAVPQGILKRVIQVYAFDPSPVTGFYSVPKHLRTENKRGLMIDRIYERGEILAIVRSITSLIHKPSAKNAEIRGIRYNLLRVWNSIAAHSIVELASKLDGARRESGE